jgi:hypothetical protein
MHVFHIRGISGILMVLLIAISALAVLVALPSAFMMVLWNALIFEGSKGPEISLLQGFLLWGSVAMLVKVVFKPEIKLQFQPVKAKATKTEAMQAKVADATPEPDAKETASKLDNQQEQG